MSLSHTFFVCDTFCGLFRGITNIILEVLASFPLLILQRLLHVFPTQLKTYSKFIINKDCNYLKHASYVQSD